MNDVINTNYVEFSTLEVVSRRCVFLRASIHLKHVSGEYFSCGTERFLPAKKCQSVKKWSGQCKEFELWSFHVNSSQKWNELVSKVASNSGLEFEPGYHVCLPGQYLFVTPAIRYGVRYFECVSYISVCVYVYWHTVYIEVNSRLLKCKTKGIQLRRQKTKRI